MTGNIFGKIKALAYGMNWALISHSTFSMHQKKTPVPVVQEQWELDRKCIVNETRNQGVPLVVARDARCDSSGHNAKYASYTTLTTDWNGREGTKNFLSKWFKSLS